MGSKPNAMKNVVAMAAVSALFLLGFLFALFLVLSLTIAEPLPSMAKEESLSLDLFTTPEVLLRFVCLLFSCNVVRFISKFESFVPHCLSKIKI
jgi:hypothetical protein